MSRTSRAALAARALRYPLRSQPRRFWLTTLTLATVVGLVITTNLAQADRVVADLGERQPVVVVRAALPAGHQLGSDDVELRDLPPGWHPADAVTDLDEAVGATVVVDLAANEIIVASRIGSMDDVVQAGGLQISERGVAVDVPAGLELTTASRVELIARDAAPVLGRVIAIAEPPTSTEAGRATIAIAAGDAPTVAAAARANDLTLVLAPSR